MRNSAFKRFCVSGYFGAREVLGAVRGMLNVPEFSVQNTNYDEYWQDRAPGNLRSGGCLALAGNGESVSPLR